MLTIEKLKEYGADVDKGKSRCANNEMLYLRLVKICVQELSTCGLGDALRANDLDRAFEIAHKLKGGVSNLALDPVAAPVSELTELLRNKTPGDYEDLLSKIARETEKLTAMAD